MTTEAGKRLLRRPHRAWPKGEEEWTETLSIIEAEAVAAYRATLAAKVEGLPCGYATPCGTGLREDEPCETCATRAAVLALIRAGRSPDVSDLRAAAEHAAVVIEDAVARQSAPDYLKAEAAALRAALATPPQSARSWRDATPEEWDAATAKVRATLAAKVEKYIAHHNHEPGKNCVSAFCAAGLHRAVLALIEQEGAPNDHA